MRFHTLRGAIVVTSAVALRPAVRGQQRVRRARRPRDRSPAVRPPGPRRRGRRHAVGVDPHHVQRRAAAAQRGRRRTSSPPPSPTRRAPRYGHYLTPAQFNKRFAPTAAQVARSVRSYLARRRLHGQAASPRATAGSPSSGTVHQIETAFGTTLRNYSYKGQTLRAPSTAAVRAGQHVQADRRRRRRRHRRHAAHAGHRRWQRPTTVTAEPTRCRRRASRARPTGTRTSRSARRRTARRRSRRPTAATPPRSCAARTACRPRSATATTVTA